MLILVCFIGTNVKALEVRFNGSALAVAVQLVRKIVGNMDVIGCRTEGAQYV